MFLFKVQLFQGCKSETEPINTKSVVQHVIRYQVLLVAYYKDDTKYCWQHITKTIQSIVGSILQSRYKVLLAAYYKDDTKYCWQHITKTIQSIVAAYYKADTKYC
jgi:peroxiredoxin